MTLSEKLKTFEFKVPQIITFRFLKIRPLNAASLVFIIFLTVLIFITGCPPVEPERIETPRTEAPKAEPAEVEPPETKPPKAEPAEVKPPETEPPKAEPAEVKPPEAEPPKDEPAEVKPSETEPPKAEPPQVEPISTVSFHDKCADILNNFVDDNGMVNYKTLRRRRLKLKHLLDEFAKLDPNVYNSWHKEDKIAFWLNAYNIKLLKIIVDNYPIKGSRWLNPIWGLNSIRHIKGIWNKYKFIVMDEEFTLVEVEQRFFRSQFDEPRVFFALSGACLSSPPLRSEPYYGDKLSHQLDDQVKRFLSSHQAFKINRDKKVVYLSAILQPTWHGREFISKYGTDKKFKDQQPATRAVLNFITNYISEQDVYFLEIENYSVKYINYNWTLNDGS